MPGHGGKNQHQRTKGNLRPSSSSHAAELLNLSGTVSTGFIGFGQAPKYVPASSSLDDMDTSLDADFRMVLRKFTKRDATTKVKACQEFADLCQEKPDDCLKAVLPFWPRTFNKLVMDIDYRVREATQQCMGVLAGQVGRNLAPYLKKLMGAWLMAQCDTYPTVASAAQSSFHNAFTPVKQNEAIVYCKDKILEYLTENLVKHSLTTLSDPKQTDQEDMENKYNRVLASSFLALRKLLNCLSKNDLIGLEDSLSTLLSDPKLWKHGKSKISMVKGAMYSFLAGLCQTQLDLVQQYTDKMSPFILHNLEEKDPAICGYLWEAVLSLVNFAPECWRFVNIQKAFWPKLKSLLENGCYGNGVVIGPNLLPLLSKIPADLFADYNKFIEDFFFVFRKGLGSPAVQKSNSECGAMVKAYMECVQLISKQKSDTQLLSHLIMDQVLPVVQASLLEAPSQLSSSPLYSMLGKLLTGLELTEQGVQTASVFWTNLTETAENRLFSMEGSSDDFENRIVHLVKCLYFPSKESKVKIKKVGFDMDTGDIDEKENEKNNIQTNSLTVTAKAELGSNGNKFVSNLILLTFKLAHKHFSSSHLGMLAELLELNCDDKVIAMVIASCHGDISSDDTLQYFVFEICMPWLMEIQKRSENSEDLIHLINIVCLFVPSLEITSGVTLLNRLYKSCLDSASEKVLIQKLFNLINSCISVKEWIKGAEFGDNWVERSRSLRQMSLNKECQVIIDNTIDVLSEVLNGQECGELFVREEYVMKVFEEIVQCLDQLGNKDSSSSPDVVIQLVSRAVLLYFSQLEGSVHSNTGTKVVVRLYQICLINSYGLTGESMSLLQTAWSAGVTKSIQQTGGLLYDKGIVQQVTEMTLSVMFESVNTLQKLNTLFENVKILLNSVENGLPGIKRENDVYKSVCRNLFCDVQITVPKRVLEYQSIKGDFPWVPEFDHEFKIQTLFTSLYNCKLLQDLLLSETEDKGSLETLTAKTEEWSNEYLDYFLTCILGHAIVQGMLRVDFMLRRMNQIKTSSEDLRKIIVVLSHSLGKDGMENLWKLAFKKSDDQVNYLSCLSTVLSLMTEAWGPQNPVVLQLEPLTERCSSIDGNKVRVLQSTVDYLSLTDQLTLAEILVARILSLPSDLVLDSHGEISLLSVISKLTRNILDTNRDEVIQLLVGVLDQILVWKDNVADLLAFSCSTSGNVFSVEVSRFLSCVVTQISSNLSDKHWDFLMCSLVSWIQEIKEMETDILRNQSPGLQCLLVSVLDLVSSVSDCLKVEVEADPESYPPDLRTEWIEFFGESIFSNLLPFYLNFIKTVQLRTLSGTDQLVLASVCDAASKAPATFILNHELPPLFIARDSSPLPDKLQTLMNHICPLLLARDYSVQLSAYRILNSIIDTIPAYDKEDKSIIVEASGGGEKDEETKKSPPVQIMRIVDECQIVLEALLVDVAVDEFQFVGENTVQFQQVFGYLLSWHLVLHFFGSAPPELRQEYAAHMRGFGYVENMVNHIFKLMPKTNRKIFEASYSPNVKGDRNSSVIQHMTCNLYKLALKTIPAMVRQWWKNQDRKTSAYVDTFTTKFVSQSLCTAELQSVQNRDVNMEDMKIRTRPTAREVIAIYGIEEVSVEIVIALPINYPLGNIKVSSEKRVGVSGAQWEKWLLQLNIFLTHQNGNIVDGLKLWRDNISKKFEGVEECMICFYVLHGTNFQLPRITCRTCKKKFHSACLYKWFNTSHNCTCPLCRNIF